MNRILPKSRARRATTAALVATTGTALAAGGHLVLGEPPVLLGVVASIALATAIVTFLPRRKSDLPVVILGAMVTQMLCHLLLTGSTHLSTAGPTHAHNQATTLPATTADSASMWLMHAFAAAATVGLFVILARLRRTLTSAEVLASA